MPKLEDVAHVAAHAPQDAVTRVLNEYFAALGYQRHPMKDQVHLATSVDWSSPFEPAPEYRCFMIGPARDGWTLITDELDVLDERLAAHLSHHFDVITVRGFTADSTFEYAVVQDGKTSVAAPGRNAEALERLRATATHVTRLKYDQVGTSVPTDYFDKTVFLGFRKGVTPGG